MLSDRIVEMKLARLGKHEDAQSGELLTATGEMKDRVRRDRPLVADIGQSISGRMNHALGLDDGKRESRTRLLDLVGQIVVDLRRALFIDADFPRRGAKAVPKWNHAIVLVRRLAVASLRPAPRRLGPGDRRAQLS